MNFQKKKTMPRYVIVTVVFAIAALSAVAKAVYTMTVDRDHWMDMKSLLVKEGRTLPPKRGNILAADGQVLAASLPEYKIYLDFKSTERDSVQREKDQLRRDTVFDKNIDSICRGMKRIFPDIIEDKLKAHLQKGKELRSRYWPVYVDEVTTLKLKSKENKRVSYVEYSEVKKLPLFNLASSANYEKIELRSRPFGDMAIHTIGNFKDTARYGLEKSYDSLLAGKPGAYHNVKVMDKRVPVVDRPAVDGYDILTTLDVNMQDYCEKALRERLTELEAISGICILMEVQTGDVKAITSLYRQQDGSYIEDHPGAVTDLYSPGSVFKPQSFLVAFKDGKIKKDDLIDTGSGAFKYGSYTMKDVKSGGYGVISAREAIQVSSNIGVSRLIYNAYKDDQKKYVQGLYDIGSAEDLKVPITGYQKPRIRFPGQEGTAYWSGITLPLMSIGYETQIAPINTLNFYNAIANNGKMVRPRFVKALLRDGKVEKEYPVEVLREQMAPPQAIKDIQECLGLVTTLGTGKRAASKLFPVAGKTGTAQVWTAKGRTQEYFVTFAGYFPSDNPQYSCIVCIRKTPPAGGGLSCAPLFKRIAEYVMASKRVNDYNAARDSARATMPIAYNGNMVPTSRLLGNLGISVSGVPSAEVPYMWGVAEGRNNVTVKAAAALDENVMPDLTGYGLRDAVCRLEALGMKVRTQGIGKVVEQSVAFGKPIKRGEVVTLKLDYDRGKKKQTPAVAAAPKEEKKEKAEKPDETAQNVNKEKSSEEAKKSGTKKSKRV